MEIAKILGLPNDFCRKEKTELSQFLLTKDFITMIKIHMHSLLNNLIYNQFNLSLKNEHIPLPKLLVNLKEAS